MLEQRLSMMKRNEVYHEKLYVLEWHVVDVRSPHQQVYVTP